MSHLKAVVRLRSAPPLTDIAGQLRQLADTIEAGATNEVGTSYASVRAAYVVLDLDEECRPIFHAWGRVADRHGVAGLFLHCAQLALTDRDD